MFLDWPVNFLGIFNHSLPRTHVTRIGLISLDTLVNVFVKDLLILNFRVWEHDSHVLWRKTVLAELSEHVNLTLQPLKTFYLQYQGDNLTWGAPTNKVIWSFNHSLVRSRDKLNTLYLHFDYSHHSWQGGDLPWGVSTLKVTWPFKNHITGALLTN